MSRRSEKAEDAQAAPAGSTAEATAGDLPERSPRDRVLASLESSGDGGDAPPASAAGESERIETPAPPLDTTAATPDRSGSGGSLIERRPEVLVAGAFAAGLALAIALRFMARG